MALTFPNTLLFPESKDWWNASDKVHLSHGLNITKRADNLVLFSKGSEERLREAIPRVELSASSYDTAWVAMVPSPNMPESPCFPECLDWILENQHPDGSWGLLHCHPLVIKDSLSCTLACILALRRWSVGEEHVKQGLHFIGSKFSSTRNEKLYTPIGFNIIFPGMIGYAKDMGLDLPMCKNDIDDMLRMRELELKRVSGEGKKAHLAYVAEGLGNLQDWRQILKYQKKNGSIFNSPSTTAALLTYLWDANAYTYLSSVLQKFGNSVPTAYPLNAYTQLCMVDNLERIGIARYFKNEIKSILDSTYRSWLQKDEEITSDIATYAMAFRLLRMNGYDISSDGFSQFDKESNFSNLMEGHLKDVNEVLELFKASKIRIFSNEKVLEKIDSWSSHLLRKELSSNSMNGLQTASQVDHALRFPFYADLERLEHKRNIEGCSFENFQILKTSYISCGVKNEDLLQLALKDFNISQTIYRKELKDLDSWVKENKLDQLTFARQKLTYCYFSAAATLFSPEISDARMSWAKNGVLTTVVDDFFDIGGSVEELLNLITLVEKWEGIKEDEYCSEQVKIVYSALYSTINELGAKGSALQNRNITNHLVEIWLNLMKSMMKEAEWLNNKSVPSMEEYMENGYVSFALGPIILPSLYFVGPYLSEDVTMDPEYHNLFRLVGTCGRLLNDMQGFEREGKEGKLNSVSLRILHSNGSISEEEAKREMRNLIDSSRIELLRLVLLSQGSVVPRPCKDLFWKMSRILHLFYRRNDGFTSQKEMVGAVNAVIHEPLKVGDHLYVNP